MVLLLVHYGMVLGLGVLDIEAHHHFPALPVNEIIIRQTAPVYYNF
jgi:hypothetical protein